jgi:hypothetical protein
MFAPETLRFARPLTLPCRASALEAACFLVTIAFALLFAPVFCYADTATAFLFAIGMYAVALYMFACLVAAAAFIPTLRIRAPWLIAIAAVTALLNPEIHPWLAWELRAGVPSFVVDTYVMGIVPYGFPFGIVGAWALVASIRTARSNRRRALAYGIVPFAIAAAYFAGYPLADRLAVVTIPRTIRSAIPLPNGDTQVVAYQLDGGSVIYNGQRYVVRDDGHIGKWRAAELVRRSIGPDCKTGEPREFYHWWYDVYVDCMP